MPVGEDTNVVRLAPPPTLDETLKAQVVETLRDALAQAERGEISAVMVCAESNGGYAHTWSGCADVAKRIGMLRLMEHRLLRQSMEAE